MKKLVLLLVLSLSMSAAFAQEEQGDLNLIPDLYEGDGKLAVKAGFQTVFSRVRSSTETVTDSNVGYYLGLAYNFNFSPSFDVQTELVWANSQDDLDALLFPILADIALFEDLSLQVGPQFSFLLQSQEQNISGFQLQLDVGVRYDLASSYFVDIRYAHQVSNSYIGDGDFTVGSNYFTLGFGIVLN